MNHVSTEQPSDSTDKEFWQLRSFKVLISLLIFSALVYIASILIPISSTFLPEPLRNTGAPILVRSSVIGLVTLLIVGWFIFYSPFSNKIRYAPLTLLIVLIVGFFSKYKITDFYGDMTPIIGDRWEPEITLQEDITSTEKIEVSDELWLTDFPQFMGPSRNGKVPQIQLVTDWQESPPEKVWEIEIGSGWCGFAVVGLRAVTHEQREEKEVVTCYNLLTGKLIWAHSNQTIHKTFFGGIGPRATPAIVSDKVYALGGTGILDCIDLKTGELIWSKNVVKETDGIVEPWGKSASPLIVDEKVIVGTGGKKDNALVAYHKDTGKVIWQVGRERIAYASPMITTIAGVRQILAICESDLYSIDPETGKILWQADWPGVNEGNPNISQPVVLSNDRVFLSKGYGGGSKLIQIIKDKQGNFQTEKIWSSRILMKTKFSNVVIHDDYVYGADGKIFECIELSSGKKRWKKGRFGHAQTLMVGDVILVMDESSGELIMIRPNPKRLEELGRVKILNRKTWNNLAISGPYLLARNNKQAVCFKLPIKNKPQKKKSDSIKP